MSGRRPGNGEQEESPDKQGTVRLIRLKFRLVLLSNKNIIMLIMKARGHFGDRPAEAFQPKADVKFQEAIGTPAQSLGHAAKGVEFKPFDVDKQDVRGAEVSAQVIDRVGLDLGSAPGPLAVVQLAVESFNLRRACRRFRPRRPERRSTASPR